MLFLFLKLNQLSLLAILAAIISFLILMEKIFILLYNIVSLIIKFKTELKKLFSKNLDIFTKK
jgi:hypothetical protein